LNEEEYLAVDGVEENDGREEESEEIDCRKHEHQ
jgi:hypothetical protein